VSVIISPSRWTRPPNGPVLLDHRHELLYGLDVRAYLLFRRGFHWAEDVSGFGFHATTGGTNVAWGNDEEADGLDLQAGTDLAWVALDERDTTPSDAYTKPALPVTLAARFSLDSWRSTANSWSFVANERGGTNYQGVALQGSFLTVGRVSMTTGNDTGAGGAARRTGNGGTTLTTGVTYGVGGIARGLTDFDIVIDGVAETITTSGTGAAMSYSGGGASYVGRRHNAAGGPDGRMFWAMIAAGDPPLDQLGELTRIPYAALQPIRPVLYSFPKAAAVGGGLSIPVAMHNYRRRRAA
jgi:hypothetical protein